MLSSFLLRERRKSVMNNIYDRTVDTTCVDDACNLISEMLNLVRLCLSDVRIPSDLNAIPLEFQFISF